MRKSNYTFQILAVISIIIYCCAPKGPSPEDVLDQYLGAKFNSEFERAYGLISQEDKSIKSLQDYLDENKNGELPILRALANKSNFEITGVDIKDDKALAVVELTIPDAEKMASELMATLFSKVLDKDFDEEELSTMIEEKYGGEEIPMTTHIDTMNLIKEKGKWKVFLNWKIEAILFEAKGLREEGKIDEAIEKYEHALTSDSKMVASIKGLEEAKGELILLKEKQEYITKIDLYDLRARLYNTYSDSGVPGVTFKLKNNGNRTLNKVEVTVYFKDKDGTVIFEEDYNPVFVTEFSFGDNKPLKPNYVWSPEKNQFYEEKSVPSEWEVGSVTAKITEIEFE